MIQEISVSSKLLDNLKILYDIIKSKHKKIQITAINNNKMKKIRKICFIKGNHICFRELFFTHKKLINT